MKNKYDRIPAERLKSYKHLMVQEDNLLMKLLLYIDKLKYKLKERKN